MGNVPGIPRRAELERIKETAQKWEYVLLGVQACSQFQSHKSKMRFDVRRHGLTLTVRPVFVRGEVGTSPSLCLYSYSFCGAKQDQDRAQRIADCVFAVLALQGRVLFDDEYDSIIPVPVALIREDRTCPSELLKLWCSVLQCRPDLDVFFWRRVTDAWQINSQATFWAWGLLPVFIQPGLFEAAQFLAHSRSQFNFIGDDLSHVLADRRARPLSFSAQVKAEGAGLSAFKAIEAIIGDPPKDSRRLSEKLQALGISPSEQVGFDSGGSESVLDVLGRLHRYRDHRIAHGSTPQPRQTTCFEILEFQTFALMLIQATARRAKHFDPRRSWF